MNASMPLVSIIVPIYNVEQYLAECLDSLVNQTLKDIEIICVNDGSPDNSADIVREYIQADSRIKLIEQENRGLSGARNTGLKVAKGEYVYFMDSDDWLEADAMDICYQVAVTKGVDVVFFDAIAFKDGVDDDVGDMPDDYNRALALSEVANKRIRAKKLFMQMINNSTMRSSVWLNFIKRKLLLENRLYFEEGLIHEDELFTPQLYALASTMMYIPCMFFHRRVRPGSIMTSVKIEKTLGSLCHIISELCAFAKSHFGVRWVIYLRCYELAVYANNLKKNYIKQQLPLCWKRISRCRKWFNYCRKIKKHLL